MTEICQTVHQCEVTQSRSKRQKIGMKITVLRVLLPCSLVEVYQGFRGTCCLHHQGDSLDGGATIQQRANCTLAAMRSSELTTNHPQFFLFITQQVLIHFVYVFFGSNTRPYKSQREYLLEKTKQLELWPTLHFSFVQQDAWRMVCRHCLLLMCISTETEL
jgi:hypothetical protein